MMEGDSEPVAKKTENSEPSSASSPCDTQWYLSQIKGSLEDENVDADTISSIDFNEDGEFLAAGDKGGRIVVFKRDVENKQPFGRTDYNVYSTFQSHEPEFDYLKSVEIEEKINDIAWLKRRSPALFLLSTNDKTIKLWKISERTKRAEGFNLREEDSGKIKHQRLESLRIPALKNVDGVVEASARRVYANAHAYHINSIAVNADQETFLSADDLRINIWHTESKNLCWNVIDIKPENMEDLAEVITYSRFHPTENSVFAFSSSKGVIRLCDMRRSTHHEQHAKLFADTEEAGTRNFFSEIIASIAHFTFSYNGHLMAARDYMHVKLWDLRMETKPVEVFQVHEYLKAKLCTLYENDCIFDKFDCTFSHDDKAILTGSYGSLFRVFDIASKKDVTYEASKDVTKVKAVLKSKKIITGSDRLSAQKRKKDEIATDSLDYSRKVLHASWHPKENVLALCSTNNLFMFEDAHQP
ncbi:hypothetical protein RvY_03812 [Ramazzottius varieornatus]|uniref:Serine/threonine-protein phosphatase 2A 55 kDa regulatory subunit B n=1 Tax=Ramazzottius varieornatus TaxID=947166 RepID=A0A1D1UT06_RAMVA|nr:hypothetical protein RvY_03812 [Ramazzottius varieornatus]